MAKTRPPCSSSAICATTTHSIRFSPALGAESGRVGQAGEITEEAKLAGVEGVLQALQE